VCHDYAIVEAMKRNLTRQLLNKSFEWIRHNWDAQNHEVPDELLEKWMFPYDDDEDEPLGFHLAVLTFGLIQYDMAVHNVPPGVERTLSLTKISETFPKWQMKLGFTEIHRRTSVKSKPLPLFSFGDDEQVRTWRANDNEAAS
jgi:hypothetical protein